MSATYSEKNRKEVILDTVTDLVAHFMYYDRKEDSYLPLDAIEDAIQNDEITELEIVDKFKHELYNRLFGELELR